MPLRCAIIDTIPYTASHGVHTAVASAPVMVAEPAASTPSNASARPTTADWAVDTSASTGGLALAPPRLNRSGPTLAPERAEGDQAGHAAADQR